jgi:hypothetical protein
LRHEQNSDWRRIWSMGFLYWNFVSNYFCFELVRYSFLGKSYNYLMGN